MSEQLINKIKELETELQKQSDISLDLATTKQLKNELTKRNKLPNTLDDIDDANTPEMLLRALKNTQAPFVMIIPRELPENVKNKIEYKNKNASGIELISNGITPSQVQILLTICGEVGKRGFDNLISPEKLDATDEEEDIFEDGEDS